MMEIVGIWFGIGLVSVVLTVLIEVYLSRDEYIYRLDVQDIISLFVFLIMGPFTTILMIFFYGEKALRTVEFPKIPWKETLVSFPNPFYDEDKEEEE